VTGKIPLKLDKANMAVRDRIEQSKTDTVNATNRKSKFD
jgi:hypothetical protein